MSTPNILLIQADQMAGPALPMYGHPVVKTPHLQRLAENGDGVSKRLLQQPGLRAVALFDDVRQTFVQDRRL